MLEALESRRLLSGITEFPVPGPAFLPGQIAAGPDGNLWFTDGLGNTLGMINPTTHAFTELTLPANYILASGITSGPDGDLWFTNMTMNDGVTYGAIGMINPTTDKIQEFPENIPNTAPVAITTGPDGNIWFTDVKTNDVGMLNPATGAITELTLPGPNAGAEGITMGPDGNIWVSLTFDSAIVKINPATDAITEIPLAARGGVDPTQIAVGLDGNLWFAEVYAAQIGVINPATDAVTLIPVSGDVQGITAGADGNVWFTELSSGVSGTTDPSAIAMINPTTHAITTFPLPNPYADAIGITLGPDGNLWFTDANSGSIGVLDRSVADFGALPESLAKFGFTLSVKSGPADAAGGADSTYPVSLSLVAGRGRETLTVSRKQGVAIYSGLSFKKDGDDYELLSSARSPAKARAGGARVAALRPILSERVVTAGAGKHRHVVGIEIALSGALDPPLAGQIARWSEGRSAGAAALPVEINLNYDSAAGPASIELAGKAMPAAAGSAIVLVARP
jgi:streptogramin lyase